MIEKRAAFESLWRNETPGVVVKPIEEAKKDAIGLRHVWNSIGTALFRCRR